MTFSAVDFLPFGFELKPDDIHVWSIELNSSTDQVNRFKGLLSQIEIRRAERLRSSLDQKRFIIRHSALRFLLGRYLRTDPESLRFECGEYGKPALTKAAGRQTIHFNMSSSQGIALLAIARRFHLGVDIEYIHDIAEINQIAEQFFSKSENKDFQKLPEQTKREAFFNCWTRKEAFIKATGDGMYRPLQEFRVSLVPGEPARLMHVRNDPQAVSRWTIQDLKPVPGFTAALAADGRIRRLYCWNWANASSTHKLSSQDLN
jgi:4'-phosphopantetheinyl transferase